MHAGLYNLWFGLGQFDVYVLGSLPDYRPHALYLARTRIPKGLTQLAGGLKLVDGQRKTFGMAPLTPLIFRT